MPWFRTRIAKFRMDAGFSNAEKAAQALEVSAVHVKEIERGASGASEAVILRMAQLYRRSADEIRLAIRTARRDHLKRALESL